MKLSILDQSQIRAGSNANEALQETKRLAIVADKLGYDTFWLSEHHNLPLLAGPAPEILIAYLAGQTSTISFGSAGIMLPNHSPLKVAENFLILENLFPGRIKLGVGRATGTDPLTAKQLSPIPRPVINEFEKKLAELQNYLSKNNDKGTVYENVKAFPESESLPFLTLLTSSGSSATTAALNGTGLSFAHFINPNDGPAAIISYRSSFIPSSSLNKPWVSLAVFAFTSEDDKIIDRWRKEMAYRLFHIESGKRTPMPTMEEIEKMTLSSEQSAWLKYNSRRLISGKPSELRRQLEDLYYVYQADEIIICTITEQEQDKIDSFTLLAEQFKLNKLS